MCIIKFVFVRMMNKKKTFHTIYKSFEYLIMSIELANAFAIFQAYTDKTLIELINNICVIYLNDILIY